MANTHESGWRLIAATSALAVGAAALTTQACRAQDISQSITRTTKPLGTAPEVFMTAEVGKKPESGTSDLTLGLGYEKADGGGHATSLPIQYGYWSADRMWNARVESGYARASAGGQSLSGVPSLTLLGTRVLMQAKQPSGLAWRVLGTVGLGVPTHGEVGRDDYSQQVRLIGVAGQDPWTLVLAGVLVHLDGQPAGLGSVAKLLHGEVLYKLSGVQTLIAKLDRSYLKGAGGNTSAAFEYDHEISKALEANFTLTKGLTKGSRSEGIDIALVYRW